MREISIMLMAGLFLFSCKPGEDKDVVYNDLFNDNLKGPVVMVETTPYKVDETGKMGEMDSCCITIGAYDSKGYFIKNIEKDMAGKVKSVDLFTHYENGLMKEILNSKDGKQIGRLFITIDSAGKYVNAMHYDSAGNVDVYYADLNQDKYGNVIAGKAYKPDSSIKSSWTNTYDEQHFVGGESTDSSGKVVFSSEVKRNEKGDRTSFHSTSVEKDSTVHKTLTYQYVVYDDRGNWTERVESENGKPHKIEKRSITYGKNE